MSRTFTYVAASQCFGLGPQYFHLPHNDRLAVKETAVFHNNRYYTFHSNETQLPEL